MGSNYYGVARYSSVWHCIVGIIIEMKRQACESAYFACAMAFEDGIRARACINYEMAMWAAGWFQVESNYPMEAKKKLQAQSNNR